MHKIRHFYHQKKEMIWKVVLVIAFLLGIIYYLNRAAMEESKQPTNTVSESNQEKYSDEQNKTFVSEESAISGESVSEKRVEEIKNTVSKFLQYCKNENTKQHITWFQQTVRVRNIKL